MKITDIIVESKSVNEAPVGFLKRAGMGIAAKLGSHTAAGGLETAKLANNLKNAYSKFLGKSQQKPNSDNIIAFLKTNGLPTGAAEKEIQQAAASAGVQLKPAKDMKTTLGIGKNTQGPMATANPSSGSEAADTNYEIPTFQRKGMANPADAPFKPQKKKTKKQKEVSSINHTGTPMMEVDLKSSTIDKIILAAVADAEKMNMGQELDAAIASAGGGGGAVQKPGAADAGADQEGGGALTGNVNFGQLAQVLPGVEAKTLATVVGRLKQGKEPNIQQMAQLGTAFVALLKADAQSKQAAINLLKKMQAG